MKTLEHWIICHPFSLFSVLQDSLGFNRSAGTPTAFSSTAMFCFILLSVHDKTKGECCYGACVHHLQDLIYNLDSHASEYLRLEFMDLLIPSLISAPEFEVLRLGFLGVFPRLHPSEGVGSTTKARINESCRNSIPNPNRQEIALTVCCRES